MWCKRRGRRYPAVVSTTPPDIAAADFVARWQAADGTELANYQLFVHDLATLLGVPHPEPAREDTRDNAYVFERRVTLARGDGTAGEGRIDCYRRGAQRSSSASDATCSLTKASRTH